MIYRSVHPDVEIPHVTITELVLAGLAGRDDAPALIDGPTGRVLTAGALRSAIQRFAGGLARRGYGPGRVVALMAPNMSEYAAAFHGAAWAGCAVTTLNPGYGVAETRQQLRDCGAGLVVTTAALAETVRAALEGTEATEIVLLDDGDGGTPFAEAFGPPLAAQAPVDAAVHVAALPYSSGTTGLPKGVMLTHRNLVANVVQCRAMLDARPGDATLAFLPFFHIYGMTVLMNLHLALGATVVTLPRFDLVAALRLIRDHRMRHLYVAPPVVLALAKHPAVADYDLGCLDYVLSGAAPLGADLAQACAARLGRRTVQGYGMTELSPVSHLVGAGPDRPGSVGRAAPNTECRIVDVETGRDAAPGATGELWVRGPQVMAGYLGRPDATAETLTPDGWLRTGDVARIDADGYLFVVDQLKELIKVRGFQVAPAEVEAALVAHPAVADVAVVGVPDPDWGEAPVAVVVPAPGAAVALADLQAFLEGRLAHYKQIRGLRLVDAIPKSPSGKILRRLLRPA
jgi:4-coumarate--CoA ligase